MPTDPQAVIQSISQAAFSLILLLLPILIKLLYPQLTAWLASRVAQVELRLTREQMAAAQQIAATAVAAVEQLKKNGAILDNKHAFETASAMVENWLRGRGILLDMTELRTVVEAAVNDLPHCPDAPQPAAATPEQAR